MVYLILASAKRTFFLTKSVSSLSCDIGEHESSEQRMETKQQRYTAKASIQLLHESSNVVLTERVVLEHHELRGSTDARGRVEVASEGGRDELDQHAPEIS